MTGWTLAVHRSADGRLWVDGVPVCAGCLTPCDERACSERCRRKVAGEKGRLRRRPVTLRQETVFGAGAVAA